MRYFLWSLILVPILACGCSNSTPDPPTATATATAAATPVAATPAPKTSPTSAPSPTPRQASISEIQSILERRYEDMGYAILTADIKGYLACISEPHIDSDGKKLKHADLERDFKADIRDRRELEKLAGESMRFSLQNDIIKLTQESPTRVAAFVKFTDRARTRDGRWVQTYVGENTDIWHLEGDGKWRLYECKPDKMISFTRTANGKTENLPPP